MSITLLFELNFCLPNIKVKAVRFYLACKFALVLLFLVCVIADNALPLAPIHVILLECFMVREGNR